MKPIPFGKPLIGDEERAAVAAVLAGTTLTHGPLVKEFEAVFARWTGAPHAVALASCTAALHLAFFRLGLRSGDEVIVPAQTHVATAHAVELCGARALFVDSEAETGNIDIAAIEGKLTPRTRAISVVHYLGMPADMERVSAIARKRGLALIEDCALAIGTRFKGVHAGLWGDLGCFSFYPVKHITTAEGGMLVTRDPAVSSDVSLLRAFGIDRNIVSERKVPGMYDVQALGFNYRMNELGAALGIEQMKRVDGFLERRRRNYGALTGLLREIDEVSLLRSTGGDFESSCYCHSVLLKGSLARKRTRVMEILTERGVGTSIYYPRAVPLMTYYRDRYGHAERDFPVASRISETSIALPVGPHLEPDDMRTIAESLKAAITEV